MRIIGGELKGRRLLVPGGRKIRPTSDRVREAIFDILGPGWNFQNALDLFAGTGSLGLEALSRGTPEAVFIEQGKGAITILRGNVKALGLKSRVWILPLTVKRGIAVLGEKELAFDLIFMDPPYGKGLVGKTLEEISKRGIITSTGFIVAEHSPKEEITPPIGLILSQERRYGDTALSFFQAESRSS